MSMVFLVIAWLAIICAVYLAVLQTARMKRVRDRLAEEHRAAFDPAVTPVPDESMSWLRRWLFLAGYVRPGTQHFFLITALSTFVLGFFAALAIRNSPISDRILTWLYDLPGGVGSLLAPVIIIGPWITWIIVASIPWLHVRAMRRRRVRQVEEDLPLTLQILATLARAGLGFDAALMRVLESGDPQRVLPSELHTFRGELLSGVPRVQAWRRLAQRLEVPSLTVFVSAMVHAEQVGGGLANVLEHQAEDVQSRRREQALVQAQSLPVKLVFPLVLCFLPGIFVWTLGPAFYQFLRVLDSMLRGGGASALGG